MALGATDAQMGALERLQSVESELMLLGRLAQRGTRAQWNGTMARAARSRCGGSVP